MLKIKLGSYRFRGRIKAMRSPGSYHCMSRVVAGAHLLKSREKEVFRKMLRKQAIFCGVEIITYAVMSNHFHLLVRVAPQGEISDRDLIARVRALYGDRSAKVVASYLANEEEGPRWREALLARMGDVSVFLKELKQRFSIWYNRTHERFGTFWAERFKSVLVEPETHILAAVAAYIDLNAVRAGMCEDPKDYRFCGYAEAVAGGAEARAGLQRIWGADSWRKAQSAYRLVLFGKGYHTELGKGRIPKDALRKVLREKGELSLADALRCRMRYFSDGMAFGSREFVESVFARVRERYGWTKKKSGSNPMTGCGWKDLATLSRMKGDAIE